jgi:hypothetical protein
MISGSSAPSIDPIPGFIWDKGNAKKKKNIAATKCGDLVFCIRGVDP